MIFLMARSNDRLVANLSSLLPSAVCLTTGCSFSKPPSAAAIGEAGLTLLLTHKILKVKSREEENI